MKQENGFILEPVSRAVEGKNRKYQHTFGGQLENTVIPPGGEEPCHLLYTLDTSDPLSTIHIEGVRFVPLIYCQQYDASSMAYRVERSGIEVDYIARPQLWDEDFPYRDYPAKFPRREIKLEALDAGVLDHIDICLYWEDHLNEQTEAEMELHSASYDFLRSIGYPFTQFGGKHSMPQTIPDVSCRNPTCQVKDGTMDVFLVVWHNPVEGVYLWDDDEKYRDYPTAQIIYQVCSECQSIHVCNRKT